MALPNWEEQRAASGTARHTRYLHEWLNPQRKLLLNGPKTV